MFLKSHAKEFTYNCICNVNAMILYIKLKAFAKIINNNQKTNKQKTIKQMNIWFV